MIQIPTAFADVNLTNESLLSLVEESYNHELIDDDIRERKLPLFAQRLKVSVEQQSARKGLWSSFVQWIKSFFYPNEGRFTARNCKKWERNSSEDLVPFNKEGLNFFRINEEQDSIIAYDYKSMRLLVYGKSANKTEPDAMMFHFNNDGIYSTLIGQNKNIYFPLKNQGSAVLREHPLLLLLSGMFQIGHLVGEFWLPQETHIVSPLIPLWEKKLKPFFCKSPHGCYNINRQGRQYINRESTNYINSGIFSEKRLSHLFKSCEMLLNEDYQNEIQAFIKQVADVCDIPLVAKPLDYSLIRQQCDFSLDEIDKILSH